MYHIIFLIVSLCSSIFPASIPLNSVEATPFTLEAEGEKVGHLIWRIDNKDQVFISNYYITPPFRANGYGSLLLEYAKSFFKKNKFKKVRLYPSAFEKSNNTCDGFNLFLHDLIALERYPVGVDPEKWRREQEAKLIQFYQKHGFVWQTNCRGFMVCNLQSNYEKQALEAIQKDLVQPSGSLS